MEGSDFEGSGVLKANCYVGQAAGCREHLQPSAGSARHAGPSPEALLTHADSLVLSEGAIFVVRFSLYSKGVGKGTALCVLKAFLCK